MRRNHESYRLPGLAAGLLLLGGVVAPAPRAATPESPRSPWANEPVDCVADASFTLRHEGGSLEVSDAGRPVLAYDYGLRLAPGVDESYRRSSYVHPLFGPDGEVLTADFPPDHRHHRGLYWAWPGVWIGQERVDQWHLKGLWTWFERWLGQDVGRCTAEVGVGSGWYDAARRRVVDEKAWLRVHPFDGTGRAIDVDLAFTAISSPVTLQGSTDQDKGYGGLQYRPAAAPGIEITAEGRGRIAEENTDRQPFRWVDYSAEFPGGGRRSGVALFAPPDHPGGAPGWTTRYYGFLGVAYPGLAKLVMAPGGPPLHLRYRVYVHRGGAAEGRVAEAYARYAGPAR
jgi:hypothetical protein